MTLKLQTKLLRPSFQSIYFISEISEFKPNLLV
jgi:hypothetical protein